jgi:hypothetical protein
VWNEKTKQLVTDGKLVVIGVVQEQHAQRAQLYQQWKQFEFPIAQDSITGNGLASVPVPILLDEYGSVLSSRPNLKDIDQLVEQSIPAPTTPGPTLDPEQVTSKWLITQAQQNPTTEVCCATGDALLRESTHTSTTQAIHWYRKSLESATRTEQTKLTAAVKFRLGVAHRSRFDVAPESSQEASDFTLAAQYWTAALAANPNQYIWRRRIEQYGPRQMKPYPFYDWVEHAQSEIAVRGETPIKLTVPLSGAEIAQPTKKLETSANETIAPDPESKIDQDQESLIRFHATVVPHLVEPGKTARVHMQFSTDQGDWNNESDELIVWLEGSQSGALSANRLTHPNALESSSTETRSLEFEFQTNRDATGPIELKGYAVYYVCDSDNGQCSYWRQDISIPIELNPK